jgi:hypothetical protein
MAYSSTCGNSNEMYIEEIVNTGDIPTNDIRISALITMALVAEQCHCTRA